MDWTLMLLIGVVGGLSTFGFIYLTGKGKDGEE